MQQTLTNVLRELIIVISTRSVTTHTAVLHVRVNRATPATASHVQVCLCSNLVLLNYTLNVIKAADCRSTIYI